MKALTLALALLVVPAIAQAASHKRHAARNAPAPQTEIACTQVGCNPVPRGCRRETGRSWDGTPTGFDVADCGSFTLYGNK